ncbi:ankyrin repeat domain-containing protein [Nitrogeniibacter aestuarii]|uniref:ankyrin repeat domain-containing protein n=1 Tax=Nitrogeniibacter aestuarii TaxID=2815343 RepID=UPI001E353879|nr:ankyrin repeat domain-containing protein [Nitrogeniibacter aestuarii]
MKRFLAWGLGLILVAALGVGFLLVRATRQHDPAYLMSCMEVEKPLMAWVCEQVFYRDEFSKEDIAELNQSAGARLVTVLTGPERADHALDRLIAAGLEIDARDTRLNHMTALHAAAIEGNTDQIKRLLAHGADRSIKDDTGRTPVDYAREIQAKASDQSAWHEVISLLAVQ